MRALTLLLSLSLVAFMGCQKQESPTGKAQDGKIEVLNLATQTVKGPNGEAIAGAKVMIGDTSSGRAVVVTDSQGQFQAPKDWVNPESVSILAPGYIRASFYNQLPRGQSFSLRKEDKVASLEIKGLASGFEPYMTEKDGNVDFGLVIPLLKREEIYFFNESKVMSAENDYMEVMGQRIPVPANVSIPTQKEKYGWFSFTMSKPSYRLKVEQPGHYELIAIRARTTVKALKDRIPPLQLLNEVKIGGGAVRQVTVDTRGAQMDFAIGEMQFNSQLPITAPALPSGMVMLSLPLVQSAAGLFPSDVKSLQSKETRTLTIPATGATDILNVITSPDREKNLAASVSMAPLTQSSQALQFLGIINKPTGDLQKVIVARPTVPAGVEPGGMYVTLSQVDVQNLDDVRIERTTRLWELFLDSWQEQIQLPTLPADMTVTKPGKAQYRWEVSFMASDKARIKQESGEVIQNFVQDITYVSRNAVDF